MNKITHLVLAAVFVALLLGVAGCSNETSEGALESTADNQGIESEPESSEEKEIGKHDNEKLIEESYKEDIGNMKIWLGGEVIVKDDKIVVNGESNLLEGSDIRIWLYEEYNLNLTNQNINNLNGRTRVNADGTFHFEMEKPEGYSTADLSIHFRPGPNQSRENREHYGDELEEGKGPFLYLGDSGQKKIARAVVGLDLDQEGSYEIKGRDWHDLPDDYGDPNVWIDAEVTNDHEYFYVHLRTNLLEGSLVQGRLITADGRLLFESMNGRYVYPDGSVDLSLQYNNLVKDMVIQINYRPNSWRNIVEAYGKDGELLEGEYVVVEDDGSKMLRKEIPLEFPELDRPEEVDMTNNEEEIKLQVPDHLLFDFDESKLKSAAKSTLDEIISQLEKLDEGTVIHINGHTDSQGNADYNMGLSEERATSVYEYMMKNGDLGHLEIEKKGYGETKPIASNDDDEGRARNRRVEIVINPN